MSQRSVFPAATFEQENWARPAANGMEASGLQAASRVKPRTVLGVLTDNDCYNRVNVLGVPHSKLRENEVPAPQTVSVPGRFPVFAEDPCEMSPSASGYVEMQHQLEESDSVAVQDKDFRLFLDLSSGSCMDLSMQSQPEDPVGSHDVLAVDEYSEDIYVYLRDREVKHRAKPGYMVKQPDITNSMRIILVDWLVEVGEEYKLSAESLYLAVNYLDRFLSCMSVLKSKLQLVGTAAMLIAAKYEEIYPPDVEDFVYITDNSYTKKQLLQMEQLFLKVLAFDLTVPTPHSFLRQFFTVESLSSKTENLALYLAELSLLEADPFLQYTPSKVAAAAYCLGNYTVNRTFWPVSLHAFTGYSLEKIAPCLKDLHKLYLTASSRSQQAIQQKYMATKYCGVSLIPPPTSIPFH